MTTIWVRPGLLGVRPDSSPEVTSSSASPPAVAASVGSLGSSDIGDVDIDLYDLDLNSYPPRLVVSAAAAPIRHFDHSSGMAMIIIDYR